VRWRLALTLAYAILAAALSASALAPLQASGSRLHIAFDFRLIVVALIVVIAALMPFFQEGFKELFREALYRRKGSWKRMALAALFQTVLLIAPLILLMGLSSRLPPTIPNGTAAGPVGQPGQPASSEAGSTPERGSEQSPAAPNQQATSLEPTGAQWASSGLFLPVTLVLLSVAAVTGAFAAYEAWKDARLARRPEGGEGLAVAEEVAEPELLEAARAAVKELEEGGDPRGAIVSYFLKLCRLLRENGVDAREEMTAREIAHLALERFKGLDPRPLTRLVELFEEARYSDHRVDEAMRAEALACFRAIADGFSHRA
jgi:hypothetical protein